MGAVAELAVPLPRGIEVGQPSEDGAMTRRAAGGIDERLLDRAEERGIPGPAPDDLRFVLLSHMEVPQDRAEERTPCAPGNPQDGGQAPPQESGASVPFREPDDLFLGVGERRLACVANELAQEL